MFVIGRPINGISLNGLEYLLDDENGKIMGFNSLIEAQTYLIKEGISIINLDYFVFEEAND